MRLNPFQGQTPGNIRFSGSTKSSSEDVNAGNQTISPSNKVGNSPHTFRRRRGCHVFIAS